MRNQMNCRIALLCASVVLSSVVASAGHIVQITNDQGQSVYINTGDPTPASSMRFAPVPRVSTISREEPASLARLLTETGREFNVDPALVDAVIKVESGYNPRAMSSKGAMGLMQLMPATAERFGVENPFNPEQNVTGGVTYLRYLLNLFNGNVPLSLAAYNAGEHSVLRAGRIPAIPETVHYVRKVTSLYHPSQEGTSAAPAQREAPIVRTVDARGVIHFTNDGGF